MNHLNFFNPFEGRSENHEDVLTRNFLLLVKNVPLVQISFLEMIRDKFNSDAENKILSSAQFYLKLKEIKTQVDNSDILFNTLDETNIVSVLISDDEFKTEHQVSNSDRRARYDGVILCDPDWLFIIENKPYVGNVWEDQLNPNIKNNNTICKKPVCLSWRNIISSLNELLNSSMLSPLEMTLVDDFLNYIADNYHWLNPYTKFSLCQNDQYLINKRCSSVLESCFPGQEIIHHRGWKDYVLSGKDTVKMIALSCDNLVQNSWTIELSMNAGDTMKSARKVYSSINTEKLKRLCERYKQFSVSPNFHFAFRQTNLVWLDSHLPIEDYVSFWKSQKAISQQKRENFKSYYKMLVDNKVINPSDKEFDDKICSKGYPSLNVCPGIGFKYTWDKSEAVKLDDEGKFEAECKNIIDSIFGIFDD